MAGEAQSVMVDQLLLECTTRGPQPRRNR